MKLPKHDCELIIRHNTNRNNYATVKEYVEDMESRDLDFGFESPEHRQRAIDTNELWEMQWYPDTPIGFFLAAAPTLEELLSFVNNKEWK